MSSLTVVVLLHIFYLLATNLNPNTPNKTTMHKPKIRHKMASTLEHNTYKEHAIMPIKEEDDDDLFEIDLDAVGNLPPPYYWESYLTKTTNNLFANCLVPIADVSSAIPMANSKDREHTWFGPGSGTRRVIWVQGAEPFQNFSWVSSSGALSNLLQKTLNVSSPFNQGK